MTMSSRGWCVVGGFAVLVVGVAGLVFSPGIAAQAPAGTPGLTEETLGQTLQSLGLKVQKDRQRFDFSFKADYEGEEWEFTMSAVLSQNGESLWLMAWLDELPKAADSVPKTALLRLLANNDRMGKGKFFAYVHENRRFVLQRVMDNHGLTATELRDTLQDLGGSVAETYSFWSVENWTKEQATHAAISATVPKTLPAQEVSRETNYPAPRRQ